MLIILAVQLGIIGGLGYIVWRNLARNEFTRNWRPIWQPEERYSGMWWFGVAHNILALIFMIGVFGYCLIVFGIDGR
jgi:hypothetical protein